MPVALRIGALRAALAVLAAVPVVIAYARPLHSAPNYDEEVYLATMRELHHGVAIGTVFLSQPPGFGWFLAAVGTAAGSLATVRAVMIAVALLGCVAAWFVGRRAGGEVGGALAAGTLAIAPAWAVNASLLEAEVPSTTLAVTALALVPRFPVLAGVAFALAVSVKLLAVTVLVPLVLLAGGRLRQLALGAAATFAALALSVAPHLGAVWDQSVAFHVAGRKTGASFGHNLDRVVHFFDLRTPFVLLAIGSLVAAAALIRRRARLEWALWTWPIVASVVLALQRPLFDHHFAVLAAAWAVPIGATLATAVAQMHRAAWSATAILFGLVIAGGLAQQWKHHPAVPPSPDVAAAATRLRELVPRDGLVATDHQIVAYLAGYREPPQLVDLSIVRLQSGELKRSELLRDSADAQAFVVGRGLRHDPAVLAALAKRYRTRTVVGSITIFAHPAR